MKRIDLVSQKAKRGNMAGVRLASLATSVVFFWGGRLRTLLSDVGSC